VCVVAPLRNICGCISVPPRSMIPAIMRPERVRLRAVPGSSLLAALGSVCATSLGPSIAPCAMNGPTTTSRSSPPQTRSCSSTWSRLWYNESPLFLELGSVVAQYGYDAPLNIGGCGLPVGAAHSSQNFAAGVEDGAAAGTRARQRSGTLDSEPRVLDHHDLFAQRFLGQGDIDGR
jgi:hypothetical protein